RYGYVSLAGQGLKSSLRRSLKSLILVRSAMRQVSTQEFERLPLRVHTFLAGVSLHDAWSIDLPRWRAGVTLDEFLRTASNCLFTSSRLVRKPLHAVLHGTNRPFSETDRLSVPFAWCPCSLESSIWHTLTLNITTRNWHMIEKVATTLDRIEKDFNRRQRSKRRLRAELCFLCFFLFNDSVFPLVSRPPCRAAPPEWLRSFRLKRSHVDRKPVLHIGLEQSLIGFVDFLDGDDFDIGGDVIFAAKVEHLLRFGDAADGRAGQTVS